MDTYTYSDIPEKIIVPTSKWIETVKNSTAKHGVKWINPHYVGDNPDFPQKRSNEESSTAGRNSAATSEDPNNEGAETPLKRRKRAVFVKYVWYVTYTCHRSGKCRDRVAEGSQVKGGPSGAPRNLQKASKKTGCKATLKVTCYKNDPDSVEVLHIGTHNHEVGGAEDLKYLPLSQARKDQIMERLRQVHQDEVYNIFKKIQESFYREAADEMESVILWLDELKENGYSTFKHSTFNNDYTFGFSSPWQKQLLLNTTMICLDATHCVTNVERGLLYTIVLRHPVSGTGCPVAYMFTKDHSMAAVAVFLRFVKQDIGVASLEKITIDVSATEHAAITAVYPEATIQWCLFHVSRAWMGKIRELVKLGSTALNHQANREIITDLKTLMWEKNQETFLLKLLAFYTKYSQYPEFLNYMDRTYLNREKFVHWSFAFQPQVYSNMETNNFVESWHNQLKTTYLGRKRNRRVDRLIHILVKDVEPDYIQNINRITLNVGRMGPEERRRRRRQLEAESINEAILSTIIRAPEEENGPYMIQSFTDYTHFYDVGVANQEMKACTCEDFKWTKIACKHMYLLQRLHADIRLYQVPFNLSIPSIARHESTSSETITSSSKTHILNMISNNVEAVFNAFKRNPGELTDEQVSRVSEIATELCSVLEGTNDLPSNSNFTRQR
ncbi:hypothetical protein [Parasitella parasitica]|uniref:SWIM-type domain-containing protein n=1 Tax=Parasitella parasitica TaxID=35722 RepID=A0A0B7NH65_9FUNG|nr:hypothetical protein [Parasitella parasitica]